VPRRPKRERVPSDVRIRKTARTPVFDSTAGIEVPMRAEGTPRNRLVTIGDSLTHGFQSGAIFNTDLSYPAIIARELGWYGRFRHPHYPAFGGIPLNLEVLIRELEGHFGDRISWWEFPEALYRIRQHLAQSEHWWDDGPGAKPPKEKEINHNLGIYGWDLRDALSRTADTAAAGWRVPDHWRLVPLIRNADAIAAIRVLHSARDENGKGLTPLEAAAALGAQGVEEGPDDQGDPGDGIETLIVALGANNALGSVISLEVRWSGDGYDNLKDKAKYNVWRPTHFKAEFRRLANVVRKIRARHVIWTTVPHVTIAPIARGVKGKVTKGSRYFKYYTRPWIRDRDFDPDEDHPYLTADDARAIDSAIDQYNDFIVATVKAGRKEGRDWRVLDLAGFLDRLASRRYIDDPDIKPPAWWTPYQLPGELQNLRPVPDSRFFASGREGRTAGGLFSLDGVHATTIAYGLMAQEFINVMTDAGVTFYNRAGAARTPPVNANFKRLIRDETLISHPPRSLGSDVSLIGWLDQRIDVFSRLWAGIG
jgi:hypothetical protein